MYTRWMQVRCSLPAITANGIFFIALAYKLWRRENFFNTKHYIRTQYNTYIIFLLRFIAFRA